MRRTGARSLNRHLLILSVVLLIPTVAFAGILFWQFASSERLRTEEEVQGIARGFAVALDREINGVLTTLQALATSPSLQSRNFEDFYRQASTVSKVQGINISLRTLDAQAIFTTRAAYGADVAVPPLLAQADQEVLRTGKALVSNIFTSTVAGRPVFQIMTDPVTIAGKPEFILGASIEVGYLAEAIRQEHLPAGWIGAVIDRNDVFVARTEQHEKVAGKSASNDFRNRPATDVGIYYGSNSQGITVLVGYARSALTGWTAAASLPTALVNATLRNSLLTLLLLGLCLALIAIAAALFASWQISGAFKSLIAAARSVGAGQIPSTQTTGIWEVNEVQAAMHGAARQLETRSRALQEINENLEETVVQRTKERNRLWETTADLIATAERDGTLIAINPAWLSNLGWATEQLLQKPITDLFDPADRNRFFEAVLTAESDGSVVFMSNVLKKDHGQKSVMWSVVADDGGHLFYLVGRDLTDQQKAEETLRQAQKMEAVGQLSGGIAHDFNNMLAVVIGSLNLLQRRLNRGDTNVQKYVDGALDGATRAASLTQRLLAFSRQQPLSPEVIDANRMIVGMTELLARTLGEQIQIETVLSAGLWQAKADPSQLENVILNLAVNARDAMPNGGRLTLETANAHIDKACAKEHQVLYGQYVLIAVSDTGTGMTPQVASRAFDPFFTTKSVGQGTGLGLSQVFGVARQSGGHVKIYSELGRGTSIKLYLPRSMGELAAATKKPTPAPIPRARSGEVVLIVEDEDRVRGFAAESLRELGYGVIEAANGDEALNFIRSGQIVSLLFTDIVMPGINGRELADAVLKVSPGIRVLYTTGYSRNAIVHNGVLDTGTKLLAKPFGFDQLARAVREILDANLRTH